MLPQVLHSVCVCNDVWLCRGRELGRVGGGQRGGGGGRLSSRPARETKCMGVCVCV